MRLFLLLQIFIATLFMGCQSPAKEGKVSREVEEIKEELEEEEAKAIHFGPSPIDG